MTTPKPKLNQRADGTLTCALGEDWIGPHPLCDAETARVCGLSLSGTIVSEKLSSEAEALIRSAAGRTPLSDRPEDIKAWAARIAADVADLTD